MTVSNSRPLALWMVMISTAPGPASTSGRAQSFSSFSASAAEIGQLARLFQLFQLIEEDAGVLEVGGVCDAGRAAEREPGALDAVAQRAAQPVRERGAQDGAKALQFGNLLDQFPDGFGFVFEMP